MTDREIMLHAEKLSNELIQMLHSADEIDREGIRNKLITIRNEIHDVANSVIDYQIVVDNLDENIMITDDREKILYVNPAYEKNSGIKKEDLCGHTVTEILQTGKYFTVATVPDVIRRKEKVMKLSNMSGKKNPGVVVGVPVFDPDHNLQYVIASNRALSTFTSLRDNYNDFLSMLGEAKSEPNPVKYYKNVGSVPSEHTMIGEGESMQRIRRFIDNVSTTDATVLITGESGCGKELVADAIYTQSKRSDKPFIKINCSSIPAQLLESELFGYERGAFSGANSQGKKGLFEAANKGTLLLDEIGDMPMDLQAKLLRAIQSSEITRVGGTKPIKLDIRLIASTNCNLKQKIKEGTFRSDLYYRLHVIPIDVPPLRERREDIPLLCRHYLDIFCSRYGRGVNLSESNLNTLTNYSWPGNIRELRNIMEYLTVCCSDVDVIDDSLLLGTFDMESENSYIEIDQNMSLSEAISAYEKEYLKNAIKGVKNLKEASEILEVDISTVSRKLRQYGLSIKK